MGFLDGLNRLVGGKPYFVDDSEQPDQQQQVPVASRSSQEPEPVASGKKYIPEAIIDRIEYYIKDDDFSLNLHIKNNSKVDLSIEKVYLFGKTVDIRDSLSAGESKEFVDVYSGDRFKHSGNKTVEVVYKDPTDDYFKSTHYIDYYVKDQGIYDIKNIKYTSPIRDINGV